MEKKPGEGDKMHLFLVATADGRYLAHVVRQDSKKTRKQPSLSCHRFTEP